jgi:hypothetical protein
MNTGLIGILEGFERMAQERQGVKIESSLDTTYIQEMQKRTFLFDITHSN